MRRGQMEMIGLVFIVMIIVVAIVMYLRFSVPEPSASTEVHSITSFLIALKETTVPACGMSVERTIAACVQDETTCASRDPCREAQAAMELLAGEMLPRQGYRYNLSVAGTGLQVVDGCNSADRSVALVAAPRVPIIYAGSAQRQLVLSICR